MKHQPTQDTKEVTPNPWRIFAQAEIEQVRAIVASASRDLGGTPIPAEQQPEAGLSPEQQVLLRERIP